MSSEGGKQRPGWPRLRISVGDPDQLPSVGAGDVLAVLLRAERFPTTHLMHIFRQGAGSRIAANARHINEGHLLRFGRETEDCFFLPAADPAAAARLVGDLVARRLPARAGSRCVALALEQPQPAVRLLGAVETAGETSGIADSLIGLGIVALN